MHKSKTTGTRNRDPQHLNVATNSHRLTNLICTMQHRKFAELHAVLSIDVDRKERTFAVMRYPLRTADFRAAVDCFVTICIGHYGVRLCLCFWKRGRGGYFIPKRTTITRSSISQDTLVTTSWLGYPV